MMKAALPYEPAEGDPDDAGLEDGQANAASQSEVLAVADERSGSRSASTTLVEMARQEYDLGVSDNDETYSTPKRGPRVVHMLRHGRASLRAELARSFFSTYGRVVSQQALTDALGTLDGFARQAEPRRLFQRVAEQDGNLWLDIGSLDGRAILVTPAGWAVESEAPVLFKRTPLTRALPIPDRGGSLDDLWTWIHVSEDDQPLVAAFLVAAMWPDIAHPILGIFGGQGTGKTTAMSAIVSLVDPSPVPYRKPPRDSEGWITAASGSWTVALDNVSVIQPWLADTLCRASTGEGDVRRRLYTDDDLQVFAFRRVVALSGIDLGGLPSDLSDRLLPITLHDFGDGERRDETQLRADFAAAHPRLLGALLDLAVHVLRRLPEANLRRLPRMADFAKILNAVDTVLGTNGLEHYAGAQARLAADAVEDDPFVGRLVEQVTSTFSGTSADLLRVLTPSDDKWRTPKRWPANARAATVRLRRTVPDLRKLGWLVDEDHGRNEAKVTRWSITPPADGVLSLLEKVGERSTLDPSAPSSRSRWPAHASGETNSTGQCVKSEGIGAGDGSPLLPPSRASVFHDLRQAQGSSSPTGQTGRRDQESGPSLRQGAVALVEELRQLDVPELRNRYRVAADDIADSIEIPGLIKNVAKADPVQATAAIVLLAADRRAGRRVSTWREYLAEVSAGKRDAAGDA